MWEYIKKLIGSNDKKKKDEKILSREEYMRKNAVNFLKYGALVLAAFAVLRGVMVAAGGSVTVSNSVDGRELPIYCVETPEKKIALTFDAACAGGLLR